MQFINKYVVRDSEEPIAGMDIANLSSKSEERGKGVTFCMSCSF